MYFNKCMSNQRRNNFSLSSDQRMLLEMYINLFNQTNRQLDALREIQRGLIQDIRAISNLQQQTNGGNRTRNQSTHHQSGHHQSTHHQSTQHTQNPRRNHYDNNTGIYYVDGRPYRFDFFQNRTNFVDTLWNNFENIYTNIVVRPTATEIQNATRVITYSQISSPLNSNCPISLEPFEQTSEVTQILGCGHIFHTDSVHLWFERNVRCPVCRYDIRTQINNSRGEETDLPMNSPNEPIINEPIINESDENMNQPRDLSNNEITQSLTNLTETILTRLFNQGSAQSLVTLNHANTRVVYDPSSNEIIFQGFY